jgi:hypothetical protein
VASSCEHGNELTVSIKCGEFVDQLSDFQLITEYSVPWI